MSEETVNVYEREKLYEEVWTHPVTQVAKRYGVSDVAIRKICKSMSIPTPPNGYWAKLKYGKSVIKTPLQADYKGKTKIIGINPDAPKNNCEKKEKDELSFLDINEKERYLQVMQSINTDPDKLLCKEVINYQKNFEKQIKNITVSEEQLERFYRILNYLVEGIKRLGYSVNNDLSCSVREEIVHFSIVECQSKSKHEMTREEKEELNKYQKARRNNVWGVYKPYIPTYDRTFNGMLSFNAIQHSCIRDTNKVTLENRIPDLISQLIKKSEMLHNERLEREKARRKFEEELRLSKLAKEAHNDEVDKLSLLLKEAESFEIAERIRKYVMYVEQRDKHHENDKWIAWARSKADWYDPTKNVNDSIFGNRNYNSIMIPQKKW